MPKCIIDGREVEFKEGENLVEAAKRVGIEIPVFCYHPALTVVAQCRMCAVEIEKMPKLQTACSTKATEGMVVHTKSEKSLKNRSSIMEFLLVNHPLDCPICDKSGECDLQDSSYEHGSSYMRSTEERRTYLDLDMGPVIQKNMNRCIHCTRCIRFGDEVAGIREMVALQRGNNTEITTIDGKPLETDYAGNYADICPTGSLTLKDFRFHKRAWMLKKTPTICEGCSRGCNMEIHHESNVIYRCVPRENLAINKYWMCDEGRFNYQYVMNSARIVEPTLVNEGGSVEKTNWNQAVTFAKSIVSPSKTAVLVGTDLTLEEVKAVLEFSREYLKGAPVFHFGTSTVLSSQQDGDADNILKRKSKTSNLHGVEKLGLKAFEKLPSGVSSVVVFRGGRAVLPKISAVHAVGVGVFFEDETGGYKVILPSVSFAEKSGTIVNFQGVEQKLSRAILPRGKSKEVSEILMTWMHYGSV